MQCPSARHLHIGDAPAAVPDAPPALDSHRRDLPVSGYFNFSAVVSIDLRADSNAGGYYILVQYYIAVETTRRKEKLETI